MARLLRVVLVGSLLAALLVAGLAVYGLSGGGYATYPKAELLASGGRNAAPGWTRTCRADGPGVGSASLCGAVRGKVLYIQHVDPDGDGDTHLVLLSGTSVRLVKVQRAYRPEQLPRRGTQLVAGGWITRGASGHAEIDARRLCPADARGPACAATRAF